MSKKLIVSLIVSLVGQAAVALTTENIVRTVKAPQCYMRQYTRAHLQQHPKQNVKAIKAIVSVMSDQYTAPTPALEIAVEFKDEPGTLYRQALTCQNYEGKVNCFVDCDGGSVNIAELSGNRLKLQNNGVIVRGGCGSEEKDRFMDAIAGGDDVFLLDRTADVACTDVPDRSPSDIVD